MGTAVPRAVFWMRLRTQSGAASARVTLCRGGSGQLRREPLAAAPGDREPIPGRKQGKGLRLGHRANGGCSPSTVCAKGLGRPWSCSRWAWGPQLPLPRFLDPRHLPSFCLWRQAYASISQLSQPVWFGVRTTCDCRPAVTPDLPCSHSRLPFLLPLLRSAPLFSQQKRLCFLKETGAPQTGREHPGC